MNQPIKIAVVSLFLLLGFSQTIVAANGLKETQQRAEQGSPEAEYLLGLMYANGDGVAQDIEMARAWWLKAAE